MLSLGDEEIAEMLIVNAADINQRIETNGWTPLHNAAENGIICSSK